MIRTRLITIIVASAVLATLSLTAQSAYAGEAPESAPVQLAADDGEDRRVEVQLAVLGLAAFVVVGVGGAAYLLRRRLDLIPPPPEQDTGGHH